MLSTLPLLLSLLACGSKPKVKDTSDATITEAEAVEEGLRVPEENYQPPWPLPAAPPVLTWAVAREEGALVVTYTVENPEEQPIWIFDRLGSLHGVPAHPYALFHRDERVYPEDPDAIFVENARHPYAALLTRGFPELPTCKGESSTISARRVGPGQHVTGQARVALPLRSTAPVYSWLPLVSPVRQLELRIAWIRDLPELNSMYADGAFHPVDGEGAFPLQRWLTAEPLPVPS